MGKLGLLCIFFYLGHCIHWITRKCPSPLLVLTSSEEVPHPAPDPGGPRRTHPGLWRRRWWQVGRHSHPGLRPGEAGTCPLPGGCGWHGGAPGALPAGVLRGLHPGVTVSAQVHTHCYDNSYGIHSLHSHCVSRTGFGMSVNVLCTVEDSLIHTVMHGVLVCLAHTCYNSSYYANEERFSQWVCRSTRAVMTNIWSLHAVPQHIYREYHISDIILHTVSQTCCLINTFHILPFFLLKNDHFCLGICG